MSDQPHGRHARTRVPIHPPIADRWSPRAFDPDAVVTPEQLIALLEAARWAATWGHRQPVRYIVGRRGDDAFTTLAGLLRRGNSYAHAAGALILVCADEGEDERTALYSAVDAGAAIANLSVEAVAEGLIVHPMAGFDVDGARAAFDLPDGVRPLAVVAVGALGDYAQVTPEIAERDGRPRERLPLEEIVLNWSGAWPSLGAGASQLAELGDDPVVE
ncbi:nitroreductase family protein [Mycobacterium crocinum]|uniref:Nitroreductase family protein n=1 Tax=Mycolicibacterium crocinum TaxID=388459 RepID=A0ABY3TJV2_9MYCO|nr:nitroreductase family protein [Mycolicibacterium crocinum]MCV7214221.1 nitroreductase family protein [Mycolicibacterium crocinum]ULN41245.1 nitroreductase family protein [Mycolicibacterium crocinum]